MIARAEFAFWAGAVALTAGLTAHALRPAPPEPCTPVSVVAVRLSDAVLRMNAEAGHYVSYPRNTPDEAKYREIYRDGRRIYCAPGNGAIPRAISAGVGAGGDIARLPLHPIPDMTGIHGFSVASPVEGRATLLPRLDSRLTENADGSLSYTHCVACDGGRCKSCAAYTLWSDRNIGMRANIVFERTLPENWPETYRKLAAYFAALTQL